ncbi:MAG: hypothetical protein ABH817_02095 [archaeon]
MIYEQDSNIDNIPADQRCRYFNLVAQKREFSRLAEYLEEHGALIGASHFYKKANEVRELLYSFLEKVTADSCSQ